MKYCETHAYMRGWAYIKYCTVHHSGYGDQFDETCNVAQRENTDDRNGDPELCVSVDLRPWDDV